MVEDLESESVSVTRRWVGGACGRSGMVVEGVGESGESMEAVVE